MQPTMSLICANNLQARTAADQLCKVFGIRLVTSSAVVQIAQMAGFDAVFIDLEHSTLSIETASSLCTTALLTGITPFVRVPHQCGDGFIQRVLDGGAMGIVVPHIHDRFGAETAVRICKYPSVGTRSMTGQLPQFSLAPQAPETIMCESNAMASTVILMIETADSIDNIDEIAQVRGVDVLLIGSNDLSIELGVPGQFDSPVFRSAIKKVSEAALKHNKIFGLAGIYDRPDFHDYAVNELHARFLLGHLDSGLLARGAKACSSALSKIEIK